MYFARGPVVRVGSGVKRSLIGRTKRRDGRLQFTYNGWPLYYYAHEGPGQVLCQNVNEYGGLWLVVRPNGTLVRLIRTSVPLVQEEISRRRLR